ncbi:MAG: phosphate acetyltransferase [Candidatus Omnitrophica bacterium]|nr:phosphate acetyltransferase [Candidatus Omnitrophota bacterium]
MSKILELRERAKKGEKKTIVLPEGDDIRVARAAQFITREDIADVVLLGKTGEIEALAREDSLELTDVRVIDPERDARRLEITNAYYELRKHKGVTVSEARDHLMRDLVCYGAMMTRMGIADGFVAGANHTSGDVARAAIQCIKIDKEIGTVSSSFVIELDDCPYGEDGLFVYGDCGIIPDPSPRQLAGIAIASSDLFSGVFGIPARVALLSYSTKGSASGESIDKIKLALAKVKAKRPELAIDGELQVDAALLSEIAATKCPGSPVAGNANVLIFPDLSAGNIAYKLTERLGKARAIGPLLQGLENPCSDLSRGCSWEDVVDAVVNTVLRVKAKQKTGV